MSSRGDALVALVRALNSSHVEVCYENAKLAVDLIIDAAKEELREEMAGDPLSPSERGDVRGEEV